MSALLHWRDVLPPPERDLLAESRDREQTAEAAGALLYRTYLTAGTQAGADEDRIDKIVFGPYRVARQDDADYGAGTC